MSWQRELSDLVAYGRRIGLGFDAAWAEALACVEVPPMDARAPRAVTVAAVTARGQLQFEVEAGGQSVLAFFEGVCRRAWEGEEVAPAGCFDTVLDTGGVPGHGKSQVPR